MKKILLISDTHGYIDDAIMQHVAEADEVWHAGDIGKLEVADRISSIKPLKAVYGNIDDDKTRIVFPEYLYFSCEGLNVLIIHIAGNPEKYNQKVKNLLLQHSVDLLLCGHSHLLKVIRAPGRHLHINPGAAGIHGFHLIRTLIRFKVNAGNIQDMDVIELGKRSKST